jgi:hypothetical protein
MNREMKLRADEVKNAQSVHTHIKQHQIEQEDDE